MISTRAIAIAFSLSVAAGAFAQTTREEMYATPEKNGGVYYAYPITESANTAVPKGYKPFYISHYGRHGSRYLISDNDYTNVMAVFDKAERDGKLTALGKDVKMRLDSVWKEARGRGGELSPLGVRQHHGIAQRMYRAFPEVFAGEPEITAKSTVVMRCAHSMFAFIEALKELNPKLVIPRESGERAMNYLNYHSKESGHYSGHNGPAYVPTKKFRAEKTNSARMMATLFNDPAYIQSTIDSDALMWGLYWVAVDMQNMETPLSFFDLFTAEELFDLWQVFNFDFYSHNCSFPPANGAFTDNAKNLVTNIVETADQYIADNKNGATLRFGHDGNIIPLAALLQLDNAVAWESNPDSLYTKYADFKVSPMGANLQMILFKNKDGKILAKFMLNERETHIPAPTDNFPYYDWEVARKWLQTVIDTPSAKFIRE